MSELGQFDWHIANGMKNDVSLEITKIDHYKIQVSHPKFNGRQRIYINNESWTDAVYYDGQNDKYFIELDLSNPRFLDRVGYYTVEIQGLGRSRLFIQSSKIPMEELLRLLEYFEYQYKKMYIDPNSKSPFLENFIQRKEPPMTGWEYKNFWDKNLGYFESVMRLVNQEPILGLSHAVSDFPIYKTKRPSLGLLVPIARNLYPFNPNVSIPQMVSFPTSDSHENRVLKHKIKNVMTKLRRYSKNKDISKILLTLDRLLELPFISDVSEIPPLIVESLALRAHPLYGEAVRILEKASYGLFVSVHNLSKEDPYSMEIETLWKIFQFYVFLETVESLRNLGFSVEKKSKNMIKSIDGGVAFTLKEGINVVLIRNSNEFMRVFYQKSLQMPDECTSNYLCKPDVILYKKRIHDGPNTEEISLVIDAKFRIEEESLANILERMHAYRDVIKGCVGAFSCMPNSSILSTRFYPAKDNAEHSSGVVIPLSEIKDLNGVGTLSIGMPGKAKNADLQMLLEKFVTL